ncbi:MAG: hypothetical protein GYB65_02425 [Chloroflexi bacterium]|nr:hypothetical protein [Chloroflexota bacterium]
MTNGNHPNTATEAPERELMVVLSDRLSVAILAITWVLLLVAYLREYRRSQRLQQQLEQFELS